MSRILVVLCSIVVVLLFAESSSQGQEWTSGGYTHIPLVPVQPQVQPQYSGGTAHGLPLQYNLGYPAVPPNIYPPAQAGGWSGSSYSSGWYNAPGYPVAQPQYGWPQYQQYCQPSYCQPRYYYPQCQQGSGLGFRFGCW